MNTKRIAPVVGAAAVLLALSACAGVGGQFGDSARAESSQSRVELRLAQQQAAAAAEVAELVRGVKAAESRSSASTTRGAVDMTAQERIRSAKQAESRPSSEALAARSGNVSVQELIRSVKQAESER